MYIKRVNQDVIYRSFHSPLITGIVGPESVGKMTIVKNYISHHSQEQWVELNMKNRHERARIEANGLRAVIEEQLQHKLSQKQKTWVVIYEVQKCPHMYQQVQSLYDAYKDQNVVKFILTSSGFLPEHVSNNHLAGRIEILHLHQFSIQETLNQAKNNEVPFDSIFEYACEDFHLQKLLSRVEHLKIFQPQLEHSLNVLLSCGGLPEVVKSHDNGARKQYLASYLQFYLENSIQKIRTISDVDLYQKLLEIIAEQTGQIRDDKATLDSLLCSRDTLKKYRHYLSATLLYQEIPPYLYLLSCATRQVKSPKGFLANNGLISYLTGISDLNTLTKSGLITHRFANWFLQELQIWLARDMRHSEISYWRSTGGAEVDFIVKKQSFVYPFVLSYSKNCQTNKLKHLKQFMKLEPAALLGFYIYLGNFHYDVNDKILYIPAWVVS